MYQALKGEKDQFNKKAFFADENFVGLGKERVNKNSSDKLYDQMISAGRQPLHSNGLPNQANGPRQSSPATGALAGATTSSLATGQSSSHLAQKHDQIKDMSISQVQDDQKGSGNHLNNLNNSLNMQQNHQNSTLSINQNACEDSFQKLYSKELDLDEDEVPLILHELNDSAIHFISKDQYDRALSLLQKAQNLLDRLMFQRNASDRFLIQCTMHNMALCFQKMGALEECSLCLDACLSQLQSPHVNRLFKSDPPRKLKRLKYECKIHMQVCALLSQLNRHQEALCHAKRSVQISQYMLHDLMELCEMLNQKISSAKKREQVAQDLISKGDVGTPLSKILPGLGDEQINEAAENKFNKSDLIYFDEQVSMLERTASKFYPIIQEVAKRMVRHKEDYSFSTHKQEEQQQQQKSRKDESEIKSIDDVTEAQKSGPENQNPYQSQWILKKSKELRGQEKDKTLANSINMKVLLGYLNQSEWMYLLNIGNIMQITPLTIHDLHSASSIEIELARDSIIEKISYLAVSYFCVSTELRFLVNLKDNPNVDPVQVRAESEFWHGKALEISCTFLPSESPLVSHIYSSYKKHHAPVNQIIQEEPSSDQLDGEDQGSNNNKIGKNPKTTKSSTQKNQNQDNLGLKVIRPLAGIDQSKHSPMVRANQNMNIALSPLNMSPNNYLRKQELKLQTESNQRRGDKPQGTIKILDQDCLGKKNRADGKGSQQQVKGKENQGKRSNTSKQGEQATSSRDKKGQQRPVAQDQKGNGQNNTKDKLMELLWREDNQDDSFIFKDEGDEGGDENFENSEPNSHKMAQNLEKQMQNLSGSPDDSKIANEQFLRNDDPLNSTTTLNFKNVMRSTNPGDQNNDNKQKQNQQMNIQAPQNEEYQRNQHDRLRTQGDSPGDEKNPNMRAIDKVEIKFIDDRMGGQVNMDPRVDETVKQLVKLEQIADLSSILKERNDADETAEDLQSMVDQQLINKNFETANTNGTQVAYNGNNKYNTSSSMRLDAKQDDLINNQQPSSIPNNEQQHEVPTFVKRQQPTAPKDHVTNLSHNKFLKDAPIEADMLMRKQVQQNLLEQMQHKGKDIINKGRPKTSDNQRMGYDNHKAASDINSRVKNFNQNNSKEIKSSHDKYDKQTRSHMNQPLKGQITDNSHFLQPGEQRNQIIQIQQQHGHNGNRAFTQQNFYGQGSSSQKSGSSSPIRRAGAKVQMNQIETLNGSNSQQVLLNDHAKYHQIQRQNESDVQKTFQSMNSEVNKQLKSKKTLQNDLSQRHVSNDQISKSQGRTKGNNRDYASPNQRHHDVVGGYQKQPISHTSKNSPQQPQNQRQTVPQRRPGTGTERGQISQKAMFNTNNQNSRYKQSNANNNNQRMEKQMQEVIEQMAIQRSVQSAVGTSRGNTSRNREHQFNTVNTTIEQSERSGSRRDQRPVRKHNEQILHEQMKRKDEALAPIQNQNYVKPKSPGTTSKNQGQRLMLAQNDIVQMNSHQGNPNGQRKFTESKQQLQSSSSRERSNDKNYQQQVMSQQAKTQFQTVKHTQPKYVHLNGQNQFNSSKNQTKQAQNQSSLTNNNDWNIDAAGSQIEDIDHQTLQKQMRSNGLEIQTHALQQQIKIKPARTSVQTPTGPRGGQFSSNNRDLPLSINQRLQQADIDRSGSGGPPPRVPNSNIQSSMNQQQTPHSVIASSHATSASKHATNDSRTALNNQKQYILAQQLHHLQNLQALQQMQKHSSQQHLATNRPKSKTGNSQNQTSSGKKGQLNKSNRYVTVNQNQSQLSNPNQSANQIVSRGGSAKASKYSTGKQSNSQTRANATSQASRYNINKNLDSMNSSMQGLNVSKDGKGPISTQNQGKSRNSGQNLMGHGQGGHKTTGAVVQQNYVSQSGAISHRNQGMHQNQTFNEDMSNMRNIQMQIQNKLNNFPQKFKAEKVGQQKTIKTAKSAGKIHSNYPKQAQEQFQQNVEPVVQSAQTSQRGAGKIQLNMRGMAGNMIGQPPPPQLRGGPLQTVRNKENQIDQLIPDDIGNFNLQNYPSTNNLNTYNHNSLETSLDHDQALNEFRSARGAGQGGGNIQVQYSSAMSFPNTPAMSSARGSMPSNSNSQINFTNKGMHQGTNPPSSHRAQQVNRQGNGSQKRSQKYDIQQQSSHPNLDLQQLHHPTIGAGGKAQKQVSIKKQNVNHSNNTSNQTNQMANYY